MILNFINEFGPWSWIIGGFLLFLAELAVPGVFLVWLGLAAVVTGFVDFGFNLPWQTASLVFGGLSILFVIGGRYLSQKGVPQEDNNGMLNQRARKFIGNTYVLEAPIVNGEGRIRVADSSWQVTGPDLPAGARVTVVRSEGTKLVVARV